MLDVSPYIQESLIRPKDKVYMTAEDIVHDTNLSKSQKLLILNRVASDLQKRTAHFRNSRFSHYNNSGSFRLSEIEAAKKEIQQSRH